MREEFAALMHEIWAGWTKHTFQQCILYQQHVLYDTGSDFVIPAWAVEQWTRQINTPYAELSEEEKDSDRREADKVLALILGYSKEEIEEALKIEENRMYHDPLGGSS